MHLIEWHDRCLPPKAETYAFANQLCCMPAFVAVIDTIGGNMETLLGADHPGVEEPEASDCESLECTTRALRTLSAVVRTLLRAQDEASLLKDMCTAIVDSGGYRRAGVVLAQNDSARTLRWVAWVGLIDGKAEQLDMEWVQHRGFTYADTPAGQTAVGEAIRTRTPCVVHDIANNPRYDDPQFAILRQHAASDGYASLTAFPLIHDTQLFGALFMAAPETDAFDTAELCLLGGMADDMAFGMAGLRLREQHRQAQETIYRLAYFDSMTGLANRTRQMDLLNAYLEHPEFGARALSLVQINVGQFTEVCNAFGQQVADQLIVETARRLQASLPGNLELARVGEAIFSIIIPPNWQDDAVTVARRLIQGLNAPIEVAGMAVDAHVHAGVVALCPDANDAGILFRRANAALFHGDSLGDGISSFAGSKNAEQMSRLALMGDLRLAVQRDELRVFCQPKIDMQTGRIVGAEALIRWQHPTLGMVPPAHFIKLAEQSGIIVDLTKWMLERCFSWLRGWQHDGIGETLAINLSAHDLLSSSIVGDIGKWMEQWKICPESVEFELTESVLVEDPAAALDVLTRLKATGVKLLLDDFGTGYASLSYLQRFPFDVIKIDQSFVMPMLDNPDSAAIVRSTIELGHILGRHVVAEGVESAEIWNCLREQGCDLAQGYLISKPIPIEQFQGWKAGWMAAAVQ